MTCFSWTLRRKYVPPCSMGAAHIKQYHSRNEVAILLVHDLLQQRLIAVHHIIDYIVA